MLPWAALILTLFGWHLVNRQNNKREFRKELRSAADRCKVLAREAVTLGAKYWSGDKTTPHWQVTAVLDELEAEISRFNTNNDANELCDIMADLINAVTCDDFAYHEPKPENQNPDQIRNMLAARQRILPAIERVFSKQCK